MHTCVESVCSYAFWLADTVALAVTCWALLNKLVNERVQKKGGGLEGATNWLVDLMLYQHDPPTLLPSYTLPRLHCFTLNLAYSLTHAGWKWPGFALEWTCKITLWFLDCLKRMWSFSWDKRWRAVEKGFSAVCPSLLTLLDGRAATIRGRHGRPPNRTAPPRPQNVCRCNRVHSRQTHAVTFWLCSSIVVAIFVTFWNYSLFENKDID